MPYTHQQLPLPVIAWQRPTDQLEAIPIWVARLVNVRGEGIKTALEIGGSVQTRKKPRYSSEDGTDRRVEVKDWLVHDHDGYWLYTNRDFEARFTAVTQPYLLDSSSRPPADILA